MSTCRSVSKPGMSLSLPTPSCRRSDDRIRSLTTAKLRLSRNNNLNNNRFWLVRVVESLWNLVLQPEDTFKKYSSSLENQPHSLIIFLPSSTGIPFINNPSHRSATTLINHVPHLSACSSSITWQAHSSTTFIT